MEDKKKHGHLFIIIINKEEREKNGSYYLLFLSFYLTYYKMNSIIFIFLSFFDIIFINPVYNVLRFRTKII